MYAQLEFLASCTYNLNLLQAAGERQRGIDAILIPETGAKWRRATW
jgi:hypothetical protein